MTDDTPRFDEQGRLIAPKYGDVYFSAEDGLAETRHVFLEGNRLAERFAELRPGQCFTIGETGFGTGLNFLAAWQLFEQHAPHEARLEFVSVEGFPLDAETMHQALSPWPELDCYREALLNQWGGIYTGLHDFRFAQGRVRLRLLVDDISLVSEVTSPEPNYDISRIINAWFLDGFSPSRNEQMWSRQVFEWVSVKSAPGATLATFTSAGHVRRGLASFGFHVEKTKGFGKKRDMTIGRMSGEQAISCDIPRVLVIGGSLAGAFVARSLAERGAEVVVVESQFAVNDVLPSLAARQAVLQPKVFGDDEGLRRGYAIAERLMRSDLSMAERAKWKPCGSFHAAVNDKAVRRLKRFVDSVADPSFCRWVEQEQTSDAIGISLPVGGLFINRAGVLHPGGLCAGLLDHAGITRHYGIEVQRVEQVGEIWRVHADSIQFETDNVVLANAIDAVRLGVTLPFSLQPVRGQVSLLDSLQLGQLADLRCSLFYPGGYLMPAVDGQQTLGASFVPEDVSTDWRQSEHEVVCEKLSKLFPHEAAMLKHVDHASGWAGVRVVGDGIATLGGGLYTSLGHGSHGVSSAAYAGTQIADWLFAECRQS